jgi:hypothetical protein
MSSLSCLSLCTQVSPPPSPLLCSALLYCALTSSTVLCPPLLCCVHLLYCALPSSTVLCPPLLCCVHLLYCALPSSTVLCPPLLCSALFYCAVSDSSILCHAKPCSSLLSLLSLLFYSLYSSILSFPSHAPSLSPSPSLSLPCLTEEAYVLPSGPAIRSTLAPLTTGDPDEGGEYEPASLGTSANTRYRTVPCCTVMCGIVPHSTLLHCDVWYCTAQYPAAL